MHAYASASHCLAPVAILEQHAKELAGIKSAAGSDAVLAEARVKAESSATDLEALLYVANGAF